MPNIFIIIIKEKVLNRLWHGLSHRVEIWHGGPHLSWRGYNDRHQRDEGKPKAGSSTLRSPASDVVSCSAFTGATVVNSPTVNVLIVLGQN